MGTLNIANFNVTFGEKNAPLLEYFDSIVYPAFTSEIVREVKTKSSKEKTKYFFDKVEILSLDDGELVMVGYFIKDTVVRIETVYENGELVKKDEQHPTSPYSTFVLFLKNHRVVFFKNNAQSPDLRSFNVTVRDILQQYVRQYNEKVKDSDKLPMAYVDVVAIPMRDTITAKLKDVIKISKMTISLYPLNGDCEFIEAFSDLREQVGSKRSSAILNSPQNRDGVKELIADSNGTANISLDVQYKDKSKGKIYSDKFTENMPFETDKEDLHGKIRAIVQETKELVEVKRCSEENASIYERCKNKILNLIRK